jgi:hypothetical protein
MKVIQGSRKNSGRRVIRNKDGSTTLVIPRITRFGKADGVPRQKKIRPYNSGKKCGDKK